MAETVRRFGWKPDVPDKRDNLFLTSPAQRKSLPTAVDLRSKVPTVFDQYDIGSCTANSTAIQVWMVDETAPYEPSRLFIYYNTRILEGTVKWDSGATIRNSIKSVIKYGFARESTWPYLPDKFTKKPPAAAYKEGSKQRVLKYGRIPQTAGDIKAALAAGYTVNFGFSVYDSFMTDSVSNGGMMSMPGKKENMLGGHAVLIVGYNDETQRYTVLNSWGNTWGDNGFFYMPYQYAHNKRLASDFWVVKKVD